MTSQPDPTNAVSALPQERRDPRAPAVVPHQETRREELSTDSVEGAIEPAAVKTPAQPAEIEAAARPNSFVLVIDISQMTDPEFHACLDRVLFLPEGLEGFAKYGVYSALRNEIFDQLDKLSVK